MMKVVVLLFLFGMLGFEVANANEVDTQSTSSPKLNLCINDSGKHGADMEKMARLQYTGTITHTDFYTSDIFDRDNVHIAEHSNCNVVNYSWGWTLDFYKRGLKLEDNRYEYEYIRDEEYYGVQRFLDGYKGIVVSSAGNAENADTILSSRIARYKDRNRELGRTTYEDRIFVVGQIEVTWDGEYIHHFSEGKYIDFVVPNYGRVTEMPDIPGLYEYHIGTSVASAETSGLFSQVLEMGVPQEALRSVLGFEDKDHVWNGITYKVLSFEKTIENAKKYVRAAHIKNRVAQLKKK